MAKQIKNNFSFGKQLLARIYIKRARFNYFITLTDTKSQVITCYTLGLILKRKTVKGMRSTYSMEVLSSRLLESLHLYKIKQIDLIIKTEINQHIWTLIRNLNLYGIDFHSIAENYNSPHNGVRLPLRPRK